MRVVITGATSFIGISLCKYLLRQGAEIYAVVREDSKNRSRLPLNPSLHLLFCDLSKLESIVSVVKDVDYFFHLGWQGVGLNGRNNPIIQKENIENALKAIKIAKELNARCFLDAGSQAEYGQVEGIITEETACNPITEYGKAKLEVYEKACELASQLNLKYIHFRIFSIYGEQDHPWTLISSSLRKMLQNEDVQLTSCTQYWNYLYVNDAVEQIMRLCKYIDSSSELCSEVFHIASEDTRPLTEFIDEMIKLTNTKSRITKSVSLTPLLSINPSIKKTKNAIGFVSEYSFSEGVRNIINYINRKCIICGEGLYEEPLIHLENMPSSAQDIPSTTEKLKTEKGLPMGLYQCGACGLVQFVTEPVNYYKDVIRAGGGTKTMVELRRSQFSDFIERFNLQNKKIVEIGCGQGEFLSILSEFDVAAVGVEHAENLANIALSKGLQVYNMFVEDENTVIPDAPYDAFVQFNFLEHQPYPNKMIAGIYNNLVEGGLGLITVPSLEYILKYNGYYELIRDHIAYYSEETFKFVFQKNGFEIIECKTVNRDTHALLVKKRSRLDVEKWTANFNELKLELHSFIDPVLLKNGKVAVWGASHQGFTLISTLNLSSKISYIIDSATFKQEKYAPASHLPIVSPDFFYKNPVDAIIIIAPGYTEEIASIIKEKYRNDLVIAALRSNHLEIIEF